MKQNLARLCSCTVHPCGAVHQEYRSPVTPALEKSNFTGSTQTESFGLCTMNLYLLLERDFSLENLQPFLL